MFRKPEDRYWRYMGIATCTDLCLYATYPDSHKSGYITVVKDTSCWLMYDATVMLHMWQILIDMISCTRCTITSLWPSLAYQKIIADRSINNHMHKSLVIDPHESIRGTTHENRWKSQTMDQCQSLNQQSLTICGSGLLSGWHMTWEAGQMGNICSYRCRTSILRSWLRKHPAVAKSVCHCPNGHK